MENKRFLKKFENQSAYDSQKDEMMGMPHVVLLEDTEKIVFASNKNEIDYASQPFTLVALEDELTIQLSQNASEYRIDDGEWISLDANTATSPINRGQKISFKITNPTISPYGGIGTFTVSKDFNVEGNIMSLLYGDDFEEQIDLSGKNFVFLKLFNNCTTLQNAENLILPATTLTFLCYSSMFYNCTSLTEAPSILPATTLASQCYFSMFSNCSNLTTAPQLLATTLASSCYGGMFQDCTSLVEAPQLLATTLAGGCYQNMFQGCTSLVEAPQLLATTLAERCYEYMFKDCTSLVKAPELPATTLARSCYSQMFNGCTSLVEAPELQATTLASQCYQYMFNNTNVLPNCSNIDFTNEAVVASGGLQGLFAGTKVTDDDLARILPTNGNGKYCLPVTTLAENCYHQMFKDCTSLVKAPELPATTLARSCYSQMFNGCTSLVEAPELQATTLAEYCYHQMFKDCTSLTTAPQLPATTLASWCYECMFQSCTNLVEAPKLLATTLARSCYYSMFKDCSSLNKITMLATDISATNCLDYWVSGVATSGTFIKNAAMTGLVNGVIGIPSGWTVQDYQDSNKPTEIDYSKEYFTLHALSDGDMTLYIPSSYTSGSLAYSVNNGGWITFNSDTTLTLVTDDEVRVKCNADAYQRGSSSTMFNGDCDYEVYGNAMSLLYGDGFEGLTKLTTEYSFRALFYNQVRLKNAENLILPATTLADSCYYQMFYGCTNLVNAPELPARTLAKYCYQYMFYNCTSLTEAPELQLEGLKEKCYSHMFYGCTSLTTAPKLPSKTLQIACYSYMFQGCTSLTEAPELPATLLTPYCYQYMFYGCSKLNKITMLATNISASNCLSNWVSGVASSGTFIKNATMNSLPSGKNGIPSGWTVQDYQG